MLKNSPKYPTIIIQTTSLRNIPIALKYQHPTASKKRINSHSHENKPFTMNLHSIRERQDQNIEERLNQFHQQLYPIRRPKELKSSRKVSFTQKNRVVTVVDNQTAVLKVKLEAKIQEARKKLEELKRGLKTHQRKKSQIISESESRRNMSQKFIQI